MSIVRGLHNGGADGANGVVVATLVPTALERFRRLGVDAADVDSFQGRRLRPGSIGSSQLSITVLILKAGKGM